jgi:hypothetical protein
MNFDKKKKKKNPSREENSLYLDYSEQFYPNQSFARFLFKGTEE